MVTETDSRPMTLQKVWTMAKTREPESPLKGMGSLKAALTATVPAKALPKEPLKLSAKAQTREFLKAARTLTVPAKAMESGKMMALMKAPWKSPVSVKEPKKAELTELTS
jgi:hypothetical protein